MRYLFLLCALLFSTTAFAQVDSDGDGVDDTVDLCNGIDASFFDGDGDGCIDPTAHARHREFWDATDLPLVYVIHQNGAPGISDGSDFTAIQAGYDAWTTLPGVLLSASYGGTTPQAAADGMDGINQVTFEDPDFLAVYGSAVLAVGITTSYEVPTPRGDGTTLRPGQIFDADMIFNPIRSFSTDTAGSGTDLSSVATHEAGHLYGFSHTTVLSSTMFPALPSGTNARSLEDEDVLMAFMSYPDPAVLGTAASISGSVLAGADSSPVGGAAVFAISAATGDTLGANYSLADGSWQFTGLAPGDYLIAMAPLEGDAANGVVPALVNTYVEAIATNVVWPPEYWNSGESAGDDPLASDAVALGAGTTVTGIDLITNVDLVPPVLTEISPAAGSTIRSDALFFLQFSEAMDFTSATTSITFARIDGTVRTELAFGLVQVAEEDVFIIDPAAPLEFLQDYELTVASTITDRFGNPLGSDVVQGFTTEAAPALQITTASPTSVVEGTVVVIYGEGFDTTDPTQNLVEFNGVEVPATTASLNAVTAAVPSGVPLGDFSVRVLLGGQTSASLTLTGVQPVDVVRGTDYAVMGLAGVPTRIALLPDGAFAYVGTSAGFSVATTAIAATDFGTHLDVPLPFGVVDVAASPDGGRVYAVSGDAPKLYVIDSDYGDLVTRSTTFNSVIDELDTSGLPVGIALDGAGERAYVATRDGVIEVWDVEIGSATYNRQVGEFVAPVSTLAGPVAVDLGGLRLFAMSSAGDLLTFDVDDPTAPPAQQFLAPDAKDLALDPRGTVGYVTDGNGIVTVFLVSSGAVAQVIDVGGAPQGFTVDATGNRGWFADRANDEIAVVDLVSGSPSFRTVTGGLLTGPQPVDTAVLPDGLFVLSAEAGSQALRLIGIGAGPELTSITPVAGRPGDYFVIAGSGFAPSVIDNLPELGVRLVETPAATTTVWFGDQEVTPTSATPGWVSVQAPATWTGEPIRVAYNGAEVAGQPNTLLSNPVTVQLLEASLPDLSETATRAVFMGADNGYPWAADGLGGSVALSPTGEFALIVSAPGRIYMVDADPGSPGLGQIVADLLPAVTPLPGSLVVAPSGKRAWFGASDNRLHTLDTDPLSPTFMQDIGLLTGGEPGRDEFVPGELVMTQSGQFLIAENLADGGLETFISGEGPPPGVDFPAGGGPAGVPLGVAVHPSGLWAAYAGEQGFLNRLSLRVNSADYGQTSNTASETGDPVDVAFTPDGRALVTVSWSSEQGGSYWIELRDPWEMTRFPADGNALKLLVAGVPSGPANVEVSPNGDRAIVDVPAAGEIFYADINMSEFARIERVEALGRESLSPLLDFQFEPRGLGLYAAGVGDAGVEFFDFANSAGGAFISGLGQVGLAGETLPAPILFRVQDDQGTPTAGAVAEVTAEGGGALGNGDPYQWLTANEDGVISIQWTMGPDVDGDPGAPANNLRVTLNGGATVADNVEVPAVEDPEVLPLNVVEVLPPDTTLDVSLSTTVQVRFSKAVDTSTATAPEFALRRADDSSLVPVAWGYANGDRNASMVPDAPLEPSTVYEIVIGAGILDAGGGPVTNPAVASFTTESVPALSIGSVSPPAAVAGNEVVIAGSEFGDDPSTVTVDFNGIEVLASGGGPEFVTAFVPVGAETGPLSVTVGAQESNALNFSVLIPEFSPVDEVVTTVETGAPVQALAVTPDGLKAYSVSSQTNAVVPVDLLTFALGEPIDVGSFPTAIAIHPDGSTAYVTNFASGSVSVIEVATDTVIDEITVGTGPTDIVASPNGEWLYVINSSDETLSVIDVDGSSAAYHTVVATSGSTRTTRGAAITPDGTLLYLGTPDGYAVFNLDPNAYGVVATRDTGKTTKGAAITPDGSLLFLLTDTNEILVADVSEGASGAVVTSVETDQTAAAAAISPDGTRLYLLEEGTSQLFVYDIIIEYNVSSTAVIGSISVRTELVNVIEVDADPAVIAVDPTGSGVVIVGHGSGDGLLTFVNTSSYEREAILAETEVDTSDLDPVWGGRAIVFRICLPSDLDAAEIDPSSLVLAGSVPSLPGSARLEIDPVTGLPCLMVGFDRLAFQALVPGPDPEPPIVQLDWDTSGGGDLHFSIAPNASNYLIEVSQFSFEPIEYAIDLTPQDGAVFALVDDVFNEHVDVNDSTFVPGDDPTGTWTSITLFRSEGEPEEIDNIDTGSAFGDLYQFVYDAVADPVIAREQIQPPDGKVAFTITGTYGAEAIGLSSTVLVDDVRARLLTPEAGEGFWLNRPMFISWLTPEFVATNTVDIRFSENGGQSWITFVEGLPDIGQHWVASPGGVSEEALVEVVFRDSDGQVTAIAITDGFLRLNSKAVPVTMGDVSIVIQEGAGSLEWQVVDAPSLEGFHVLRSMSENGEYQRVSDAPVTADYDADGAKFAFVDEEILGNRNYFYLLEEVRSDGEGFQHGPYRLNWKLRNELMQNVPNSFNPKTTISFSTARDGRVRLAVYSLAGRLVDVLVDEHMQANAYDVVWEGRDRHGRRVASGVYLYQLTAPGFSAARKMTLVK